MDNPFDAIQDPGNTSSQQQQQGISNFQSQSAQVPSSNPFDSIQAPENSNINIKPPTNESAFYSMVDGFNRQFEKAAIGTLQLGSYLIPGSSEFRDNLNKLNNQGSSNGMIVGDKQATQDWNNNPKAYAAGAIGGTVGLGLMGGASAKGVGAATGEYFPVVANTVTNFMNNPNVGALAARTIQGVGSGAAYGAIMPSDSLFGHAVNSVISGVIGGLASNVIPAMKSVKDALTGAEHYKSSLSARMFTPQKAAVQDTAAQLDSQLSLLNPENAMGNPIVSRPSNLNTLDDLLSNYQKLNIAPRPGEVSGSARLLASDNMAAREGGLQAADTLGFNQQQELNQIQKHISTTIKNMAPEDVHKAANEMYKQLPGNQLSSSRTSQLLQDTNVSSYLDDISGKIQNTNAVEAPPSISRIMGQADNTASNIIPPVRKGGLNIPKEGADGNTFNLAELPDSDIAKLDYVKQNIGKKLWNDAHSLDSSNKMLPAQRDSLRNTYNQINEAINAEYPNLYGPATEAAQKVTIQNNYLDLIQQIKNKPGVPLNIPKGVKYAPEQLNAFESLDKINKGLFGSDDQIQAFLNDVGTVGGDIEAAKAIVHVANQLAPANVNKIMAASAGSLPDFLAKGRDSGMIQSFILSITNSGYEHALLNLTTSGNKWVPLIKQEIIKQTTAKAKSEGFMKLILKAATPTSKSSIGNTVGTVSNSIMPSNNP